jgi:hypothetical protein
VELEKHHIGSSLPAEERETLLSFFLSFLSSGETRISFSFYGFFVNAKTATKNTRTEKGRDRSCSVELAFAVARACAHSPEKVG